MDRILLPEQSRDLGFGIKSNHVNILRLKHYWEADNIAKQLKKYNIPIIRIIGKQSLIQFIVKLTLNDIKNGCIILVRCNKLTLTDNMFKGEIKQNNITVNLVGISLIKNREVICFGRKRIKLPEFELILKSKKISKIKQNITNKQNEDEIKEIMECYKEFDILIQGVEPSLLNKLNDLVRELIKERKKEEKR